MTKTLMYFALAVFDLAGLFIVAPALLNMQNDGALILLPILLAVVVAFNWFIFTFVENNLD